MLVSYVPGTSLSANVTLHQRDSCDELQQRHNKNTDASAKQHKEHLSWL